MKYLLDTAVWANSVLTPEVLPARVLSLLKSPGERGIASVSLLETAILHRLGRLEMSRPLRDFYRVGIARNLRVLDLTPDIADATNALGDVFHGDPFDRAIVATARVHNLTLITADRAIRDAGACPVEFYPFRPGRIKT